MFGAAPGTGHALAVLLVSLLALPGGGGAAVANEATSPGPDAAAPGMAPEAPFQLLVDAPWLAVRLSDPGVRVVDIRGEAFAYDAGHIPGAVYLDKTVVAQELDGAPGSPPDADRLAAIFRAAGVSDSSTVVVYDGSTGVWATRVFWALDYLGHEDVRVLDGGWARWTCETLPVEAGTATPAPGDFAPRVRDGKLATKDWILGKLGDPDVLFLDVRSPAEYAGEEKMADRGGHIPGAVGLEWKSLLAEDGSGTLIPVEGVREALAAAGVTPDREVVTYCQVGGRAAHTYFALRLAGYGRVRLYEGSWAEWGNDPAAPVASEP